VVFGTAPGRLGVFPGLGVVSIVLALSDLVPATSLLSTIVTAGKQSWSRENKKPKRANHRAIRNFRA